VAEHLEGLSNNFAADAGRSAVWAQRGRSAASIWKVRRAWSGCLPSPMVKARAPL
jgi:hypothetical protein